MKRFIGFIRKEILHILRDPRSMIILFGMPVAQIIIFGFVISNEIKDANIAIYDMSKDAETMKIISKIQSSGYFKLVKNIENQDEIEQYFKAGKIREVIIFEKDFAKKLVTEHRANIQILTDASDANTANLLTNYTSAVIFDYVKKQNELLHQPMQIVTQSRMLYNEELKGAYMFVPGTIALILMLISAMMTSITLTREKEMGTMEVLLVSPLKPFQIIAGKVTPYVILSSVNAVTILLMGYFIFGVPVKGSLVLLMAEFMLFIIMALSLGIFISTVAKNQQVAMFVSMFALMLPTMLLSGFIFPVENMPKVLQWLAHAMPPKYFVTILKNIMLKGTGFGFVWKETLILIAFTVAFIGLSVKKFKVRLE